MPTFPEYRYALARELGPSGQFIAESGDADTIVCSAAFQSTELPTSALAYAWVFVPGLVAPTQRRVAKNGLSSGGVITLDAPFGSPIAAGFPFWVTTLLPSFSAPAGSGSAMLLGLGECVQMATRHILVETDDQALTLVDDQRDYPLGALGAWLDRPNRLLGVKQQDVAGSSWVDAATRGHPWELRGGPNSRVLHFVAPYRFSSGSHGVRLHVRRPADTYIKAFGTASFAASTDGLVSEGDEAAPDVNSVVEVAKVFAYAALRDSRISGPASARWGALYEAQLPRARAVRGYDTENDVAPAALAAAAAGQAA